MRLVRLGPYGAWTSEVSVADHFTNLFRSTVASSIWQRPDPIRIVWITMLALADEEGCVFGSIPGLAHIARVSLADCEQALRDFQDPDHYSRDPDNDGRRVAVIDGGWLILNYRKWRRKAAEIAGRKGNAERQRRFREKHKGSNATVTDRNASSRTETETYTEDKNSPSGSTRARKARRRQKTAWPEGFELTERRAEYARQHGHDPDALWALFHDKALANDYRYADWDAAWRNWCRSERNTPRGKQNGPDRKLSAAERTRRDSAEYLREHGNAWAQP